MNREIKFRAWDDGIMVYSNAYKDKRDYCEWDYLRFFFSSIRSDAKVMQSTGLKDKNGTEIYEGDVIQTERQDWGVIIWNAPFFEVTVSETQSSMYSREWFYTVEVIGNIYNNPELIKS